MTQAWDFVDASVLWQSQSAFLRKRVCEIEFGDRYTPRIRNACFQHSELIHNEETDKYEYVTRPIVTVADMVKLNEAEWLRMPNLGRKSIAAMRFVLAEHGLTFGM